MCRGTQKYEIVRRGWGTEIGDVNIWGRGLCGDFEPSGQTLGVLILGGGKRFREETGRGSGVQGKIWGSFGKVIGDINIGGG